MIKPLTKLELLWHKDPLTVEDAAILLSSDDRHGRSAALGVLTTAIEAKKLSADIELWDSSGYINQHETTIRMEDFKNFCLSIGVSVGDSSIQITQPVFDKTSPTYPPELDIALQAWQAVSATEDKKKPKARIKAWLDSNTELSNEAKERVATVVNWDKTGGATRTE